MARKLVYEVSEPGRAVDVVRRVEACDLAVKDGSLLFFAWPNAGSPITLALAPGRWHSARLVEEESDG